MLVKNKYVIKEHAKLLSSRKTYDIIDPDTTDVVATAEQKTTLMANLIGMVLGPPATAIEIRAKGSGDLLFTVRRRGLLFKKVEVLDGTGKVIGLYKAKRLSLSGGFHVYNDAGKHIAEIRGKLLKSEYRFFTPDGKTEMGAVSKKWGGMAKELFTSADTYGVEVRPEFAEDAEVKIMILGAAIAADALLGGKGGSGGGGDSGGDDE
ncbi:hypothetical protein J0H58_12340 [bacterium]|nr:hypothetical protein [bacterium]